MREFVYTSSIVATTMPLPGNNTHVTRDTWNDAAVQAAWTSPPYDADHGFPVYMASKVAAEKEVWKFAAEKKPHFAINTVNPASIAGQPLHRKHVDTPAAWVRQVYDGNVDALTRLPASESLLLRALQHTYIHHICLSSSSKKDTDSVGQQP